MARGTFAKNTQTGETKFFEINNVKDENEENMM